MIAARLQERMDMVRHHNERVEDVAISVKMTERVSDYSCHPGFTEKAPAMAAIEPFLAGFNKASLEIAFRFPIPGFGMMSEPVLLFLPPLR